MEKISIKNWITKFLKDEPLYSSSAEVFNNVFGDTFDDVSIDDITEFYMINTLEYVEFHTSSHDDLFSALAFLRALFIYIERKTGADLPDVFFPQNFTANGEFSQQKASFLMAQILQESGRHALCLWLVLRTDIPIHAILKLLPEQITFENDSLVICYDSRKTPSKKPPEANDLATITLSLDESNAKFWNDNYAPLKNNSVYLASGSFEPEKRSKLQRSLSKITKAAGLYDFSLDVLSDHDWNDEHATEGNFFADAFVDNLSGFKDIIESDKQICKLAVPDVLSLSKALEALPIPVVEHSRRVRQISSFIVEFIRSEDWFIDLEIDEYKLLTAVYFHDMGKTSLKLDELYPSREQREKNANYRNHTVFGLEALSTFVGSNIEDYPKNTFCGLIRDAIADHHERPDGKGFPNGKKKISFIGSLTAIADAIDHEIFKKNDIDASISDVVDHVLEYAGTKFDVNILSAISAHRANFINLLSEIRDYYQQKRKWDAYGMRFQFRPFVSTDGKVIAYEAHLLVNDPYYGMIDSDNFLPLMESNPQYSVFVRLQIKRLCRMICMANDNGIPLPPFFIKIATREPLRPRFFYELFKIFISNNIRYHQIIFAIDENDAIENSANVHDIAEKFRLIGAQIALYNFGGESSLLPSIDRILPDFIIMRKEFSDAGDSPIKLDFLHNVSSACKKLSIKLFMAKPVRTDIAETFSENFFDAFADVNENDYLNEESFDKL